MAVRTSPTTVSVPLAMDVPVSRAVDRIWFAQMLRAVAVLVVVACHLVFGYWERSDGSLASNSPFWISPIMQRPELVLVQLGLGPLGVGIFFIISGFVIPFSLSKLTPAAFGLARLFRIFPTLCVSLFLTCLAISAVTGHTITNLTYYLGSPYWWSLSLIGEYLGKPQIEPVVWSLQIELLFYLICGLGVKFDLIGSAKRLAALSVVLSGFAFVMGYCNIHYWQPLQIELLISRLVVCVSSLLLMFVGVGFHNVFVGKWGTKKLILLAALCYPMSILVMSSNRDQRAALIMGTAYTVAFLIFSATFIIRKKLRFSRPLNAIADISYPLYLTHCVSGYAILDGSRKYLQDPYLSLGIVLAAVFINAWMLHVVVENPSIRFGKWIAGKILGRPVSHPSQI